MSLNERDNLQRCLKTLMQHLEELQPILITHERDDQAINEARDLVRTFVLSETSAGPRGTLFRYRKVSENGIPELGSSFASDGPTSQVFWSDGCEDLLTWRQYVFMGEILILLVAFAQERMTRERAVLAQELCNRASDFVETLTGEPWSLAKAPTSEPPRNDEWPHGAGVETPYLDLIVDIVRQEIQRSGYPGRVILSGPVAWPMFLALFDAEGALLSRQQVEKLPGEREAARRTAKQRINEKLKDLGIEIPSNEWRLLEIPKA